RNITLQSGVVPNLSASVRTGYFGALPTICIELDNSGLGFSEASTNNVKVYPNPFIEYIIVESALDEQLVIYDLLGNIVLQTKVTAGKNVINTSLLKNGMYILTCDTYSMRIIK
ncbi:MAG: T9SS type A sorting domain-containing protein, partial [Paludibacteraceae bacterium]|nr:T9SS type A sorting domain-containing protein [Paludibacteraceae bacterium]MBN2787950.1 T9SS type A sorting domain-containing protein [Paludibacteraceae bacterium]